MAKKRKKADQEKSMIAALEIPEAGQTFIELQPPPGIVERALVYGTENGLKGVLDVTGPSIVRYPIHGHGWTITLRERSGKCRMGTVRCDQAGNPVYWTLDGAALG